MHKMEKHKLLMEFDAGEIHRALFKLKNALKLKPLKVTETLRVIGFDLSALEAYAKRRFALQLVQERIESYSAESAINECDLAVCRSTWQSYRDYRKRLMILMENCEIEQGQQEVARSLFEMGKAEVKDASR